MITRSFMPISPYVILPDGSKKSWFDSRGNVQIVIQDQFTQLFDFRLAKNPGASTIAVETVIESHTVIVADASTASVGNYVAIYHAPLGISAEVYVGKILAKATNTLTVDTPINLAFPIGDIVLFRDVAINAADGSVTPQIFDLPLPAGDVYLDITRIILAMECSSEPDDSKFGNLAALTRGIVIRHNSVTWGIRNIWNAKTNGDLAALAYDVLYTDKAGGGNYAVRCLLTLNAQRFHGVTIRMEPGDKLELVVQDDLTSLVKFRAIAEGHVVD